MRLLALLQRTPTGFRPKPLLQPKQASRSMSNTPKEETYEQAAKKQMRDYQKWRRHFTWRKDQVVGTLRDYSLWSLLALLAYYNMYKREELSEYDARTFVLIDKLQERIHKINPQSTLLLGTIYEPDATKPVSSRNSPIFF